MLNHPMGKVAVLGLVFAGVVFAAGCGENSATGNGTPESAMAQLSSTSGSGVSGTVHFRADPKGVRVTAELTGLTPGDHGFHIHEKGDCSAPDASSAGDHFNPTSGTHGAREADHRHLGDLGNLTAGPDGRAQVDFVDTKLTLTGANSIIGRAVIVHAGPDDLKSQPSGNAGGRVACGVIVAGMAP